MQRYKLANSIWPRIGGDLKNQSNIKTSGIVPTGKETRIILPTISDEPILELKICGGVVIGHDDSYLVAAQGILSKITPTGEIAWANPLFDDGEDRVFHSAPVALHNGNILFCFNDCYKVFDPNGNLIQRIDSPGFHDRQGISPNITPDGRLILNTTYGDLYVEEVGGWSDLGHFGHDVVPPAVYDDGSLAVAGYYGPGLCKVALDGTIIWMTHMRYADSLPCINDHGVVACGSLNEEMSQFVASDGSVLGVYDKASTFAVYGANEWVALSRKHSARLKQDGTLIWETALPSKFRRRMPPIVDLDGNVTIVGQQEILLLNGVDGSLTFSHPVEGDRIIGFTLSNSGTPVILAGNTLTVLE